MRDKNNGEIAKSQMFGYALFGCGANCLGGILGSYSHSVWPTNCCLLCRLLLLLCMPDVLSTQ